MIGRGYVYIIIIYHHVDLHCSTKDRSGKTSANDTTFFSHPATGLGCCSLRVEDKEIDCLERFEPSIFYDHGRNMVIECN